MTTTRIERIQTRRDTAANFASGDPVLSLGESGVETDTHIVRRGDGITAFTSLPIISRGVAPFDKVDILQADTALTTSNTSVGDIIEAQGFRYESVAFGQTFTTAGGVKLKALPNAQGFVTLKQCGAPGTEDQTADELAWDAAFATGDAVLIDEGVFVLRLKDIPSNRHFQGLGYNSVIKHPTIDLAGGASKILLVANADNITGGNFRIDGNKSGITNGPTNNVEGVNFNTCTNVHLKMVWANDCFSESLDWDVCTDCSVEYLISMDGGGTASHISENCERVFTRNSWAFRQGLTDSRPAFDCYLNTIDCGIENCISVDSYRGFSLRGIGSSVKGFRAYDSQEYGGYVSAADGFLDNIVIDGAVLDAGTLSPAGLVWEGEHCNAGSISIKGVALGNGLRMATSDNSIASLDVEDSLGSALNFTTTGTFGRASRNTINYLRMKNSGPFADTGVGNKILSAEAISPLTYGYQFNGEDGLFANLVTDGAGVDGFLVQASAVNNLFSAPRNYNSTGAGFRVLAGATDTSVKDGVSVGHGTAPIVDGGTDTQIAGGRGPFGEIKRGTIAANGGATTIQIAHGLGVAPLWVNVWPNSVDAEAPHYLLTLGVTNITVTFPTSRAAGTGNVSMRWEAGTSKNS